MKIETLQARVTAATERHIAEASGYVDEQLAELSTRWRSLGGGPWTAQRALGAGSVATSAAHDAAAHLARVGVDHARTELAIISDGAGSVRAAVPSVDTAALRQLGVELADRIHLAPPEVSADEWLATQEYQAVRIVDTEAMRSYGAGRRAVAAALKQAGDGEDYRVRSWVPAILTRWNALADRRRCAVCRSLDGQVRPILASFGEPEPPTHPRCRCVLQFWPIAVPTE